MTYFAELCSELKFQLNQFQPGTLYVGFSGGLDSRLLLSAACEVATPSQVVAIHVHHGLSRNADSWAAFCGQQAATLGCGFHLEKVAVTGSEGIEAGARAARYDAFTRLVQSGRPLFLAHHLDDQVETFFLRLMRGTGVTGLQGMMPISRRDGLAIVRPWLDFSRLQLEVTAAEIAIDWIDDESNQNNTFDRNYLRLNVLPLLEQRWPKYRSSVQRLMSQIKVPAQNEAAAASLSDELAHRLSHDGGLKWVDLDSWPSAQKLTLLHAWLHQLGVLVPSQSRLQAILTDIVDATADAQPKVELGTGFVGRHGPALYWVPNLEAIDNPPVVVFDGVADWRGIGEVGIATNQPFPALRRDLPDLHWRLRTGGETLHPYGRSKKRDLKRLMQEYRVKPWLRDRTPLLYSGTELVAAGNDLFSVEHLCGESELGIVPCCKNVD